MPATTRSAALGQPAGERLEDAPPFGGSAAQRGLEHGQLVVVGEERGTAHGRQPWWGSGDSASLAPVEERSTEVVELELDVPWITLVWNDPVNLMSYVTYVFETYFGYPRAKAEKLMLDVHTKGKAVVSHGSREEMERDTEAMHGFGLWATFEKDA